MDRRLTSIKIALLYAASASLWIFSSDSLLSLAIPDAKSLIWLSTFKGIAFVVVTTSLLYLLLQSQKPADEAAQDKSDALRTRNLLAVFLCLALIVPLSGLLVARAYGSHIQRIAFDDLSAIAQLKSSQITSWLGSVQEDAEELSERTGLADSVEQWLKGGSKNAKADIFARIATLAETHDYEPAVLDLHGHVVAGAKSAADPLTEKIWSGLLVSAISSKKTQRSHLYRDGAGRVRLDYVVPLHLRNRQRIVGAIVLRAPVEHFLFPLIQSWPTSSPTAETVLARREGDQALFLNELRHRKGTALTLRLPLERAGLPAAAAIQSDAPQTMEGNDYRGVRVLAATRPIKGTGWSMVAKVDRNEVMAPLAEMLFWVGIIAILVVLVVATAVLFLWRQQQRFYRMTIASKISEKDKQLKLFYDLPFIGMAISSPADKTWLHVNDHLCEMLGYTRAELLQTTWAQITHPDDLPANLAQFERLLSGELDGFQHETHFLCKNGSYIAVNINIKCARDAKGQVSHIVAMVEDITERKRNEESLRQAATVFESSHDGAIITDADGNILASNQAYQQCTGYSNAELLGKNPRIFHSGRHGRNFFQAMWRSIKELGYWQGEVWNRRKNGEPYPERLTISAVKNAGGITTHYVGISSDLSQLKQSETQLEHLTHYDPLTDLPNRLLMQSHLTHALAQAQRHRRMLGLLYLDLDRFKNINDSLGYPIGDQLLVLLTARLTQRMRGEDMLGRLSGDEFVLIVEHMESTEDAAGIARSILELFAEPFVLSAGQEVFIGASIGISIFPNDGTSADQLLQHADAAMHHAKEQGRNTYRFYIDSMTKAASEHLELETRLRHAIACDQLRVYYQPQVDIASGRIVGAEALVRWQDPERGLIPPASFIPLAEETGLIDGIGEWVLGETCAQGARWIEAGLPFLTLAVNLSPHQFLRGNIAELVSDALNKTGFPAARLELELTESALMKGEEEAIRMLHLLRAQDIRLAIDDFGTGYSSLSYLKRFPLDVLKIDKSFVDDIPFHRDDMEIAAAIIAMGHTLGFKVLAEGVETAEQLAFLQQKGCDMYQGYLTSPPLPAEQFEKLLQPKQSS